MDAVKKLESKLLPSETMPVLFIGHGNPMNAIIDNPITQQWALRGKDIHNYQAIVVISAHWLTVGTHITDAPKQPVIYDMYGFPAELYRTKYDANGDPVIAELLRKELIKYEAVLDSSWGLDHGTWSVLKHLAPHPSMPVLQISLDVKKSLIELTEMFTYLKKLRNKGVLFIGSGNIVHNLRAVNFTTNKPFDWALEFDALSADAIQNKRMDLLTKPGTISSTASFAIPTDDHYRPMLAAMALLDDNEQIEFFNEEIELGSISMRSFVSS